MEQSILFIKSALENLKKENPESVTIEILENALESMQTNQTALDECREILALYDELSIRNPV